MPISGRTYILIGAVFGLFIFLISLVFTDEILAGLAQLQRNARGFGAVTTAIVEPFVQIFRNGTFGAVAAAVMWPLVVLWFFLLILLALVVFATGVATDIQNDISFIQMLL